MTTCSHASRKRQTEEADAERRVIFLVSFMNMAGAQHAAVRVAKGLRGFGCSTEVWFFYKEAEIDVEDVPVRVFFDGERPTTTQLLRSFVAVWRELRRLRPEALVTLLPLANVVGQVLAVAGGVPRRIASQRSPFDTFSRAMQISDLVIGTLGIYSRVVAVSGAVRDSFARAPARYQRRFCVVYNGLDWQPSELDRATARDRFDLPADAFIALSVGRFKPQKNYTFQVEIARLLKSATIIVAGDGPDRAAIQARVAELALETRMRFLGNVPAAEMHHLLAASDCFIQPSLFEGQSNALLEAMHQGLPVLVSATPSQRETVIDPETGACGLLLPISDAAAWSSAIEALAANPKYRAYYATRASRRARAFTLDRQIQGFAEAIGIAQ